MSKLKIFGALILLFSVLSLGCITQQSTSSLNETVTLTEEQKSEIVDAFSKYVEMQGESNPNITVLQVKEDHGLIRVDLSVTTSAGNNVIPVYFTKDMKYLVSVQDWKTVKQNIQDRYKAYLQQKSQAMNGTPLAVSVPETEARKGNGSIVVMEFSSFGCPFCRLFAEQYLSKLESDYIKEGKITYEYRHFFIGKPHEREAAKAFYCAFKQGKGWEYHDLIFQNQTEWETSADATQYFLSYAESLSLNLTEFQNCYSQNITFEEDNNLARAFNAQGTPTFVVVIPKQQVSKAEVQNAMLKMPPGRAVLFYDERNYYVVLHTGVSYTWLDLFLKSILNAIQSSG